MVPCQPRQLVILSLPFAALVAFFWFKRRRSLSRSDPGGTVAQLKPGDTTPVDRKLIIVTTTENKVVKSEEAVDRTPLSAEEGEIVAKFISQLEHSHEYSDLKVAELVEPVESAAVDKKKEILCNGPASRIIEELKVIENQSSTSEFESNSIFHSTIIGSDKDIEETGKTNSVLDCHEVEDDHCNSKQEEVFEEETALVNGGAEKIEVSELTQTVPLEEQSTVEYIPPKKTVEYESELFTNNTVIEPNFSAPSSDTLDTVENVSVDTGLGSQDPSAVEDCTTSMAQGQKTDEKTENTAGLEQKLASLGLDTTQQPVLRSERDSANHSPAEVMLNSPAISTFSDAHSEGSSDSGKGCSDVVTPPSRTPAGGSSVAGDLAPSVYEFVLPQVIVGRLIGRHGAFLQDIRAKTHTNLFIKKHPETNSLKVCAIEGTQQDIDSALKMIRQKFPLRRFPDLTLEKVSFVKNPCLPINPENLQLHLVEGVNNDVILSSLITAGHFFLQMPMHLTYQSLYKLACIMNSVYNTQESPPLVEPQPNVVCVAPAHGGWYRAQILSVEEETNSSEVKFLDYGGYMTVDNGCLRQIRGDFLMLPFQAVECVLANVVPAGGEETWSEEANQFVQLMTTNQTLQAQVYDYTETGLPLVYLYCTQFYQSLTDPSGYETKVVLLNQELVSHGFADLIDSSQEDQTVVAETT